jgi:hypothetical protein
MEQRRAVFVRLKLKPNADLFDCFFFVLPRPPPRASCIEYIFITKTLSYHFLFLMLTGVCTVEVEAIYGYGYIW